RGEEVPVPREIDLQYAVAAALVGRAIRSQTEPEGAEKIGHILAYAGRFPQREMGVMLVSDLHRAIGNRLFEVPAFGNWAQSISDLMLYA
ncbi:MAG: ATPase, partial [Chromatiaceae bacterium]